MRRRLTLGSVCAAAPSKNIAAFCCFPHTWFELFLVLPHLWMVGSLTRYGYCDRLRQMSQLLNRMIAGRLEDAAQTLRQHGAGDACVGAYVQAASSVRRWPISMSVMYRHRGIEGLEEVPGVGPAIARGIEKLLLHHRLLPLGPVASVPTSRAHDERPSLGEELLDVDREYREQSAAGTLPLIAPYRHNPTGNQWLPVLHTRRGLRCYTALYSNTERAHRLGRTRDWVVLYVSDGDAKRQFTVITATHGALRGHRVVAGHERTSRTLERHAA